MSGFRGVCPILSSLLVYDRFVRHVGKVEKVHIVQIEQCVLNVVKANFVRFDAIFHIYGDFYRKVGFLHDISSYVRFFRTYTLRSGHVMNNPDLRGYVLFLLDCADLVRCDRYDQIVRFVDDLPIFIDLAFGHFDHIREIRHTSDIVVLVRIARIVVSLRILYDRSDMYSKSVFVHI